MKIGIVSDTHSNYHALEAVLEHMNSIGVDKKVHLGDCVGYGPKPSETLELTLKEFNYIVMGNHDLAVVNEEESWGFNPQAKFAVDWTREKMTKEEIGILESLEDSHKLGDMLFVHGSPSLGRPHDYITDHIDAKYALGNPTTDFNLAFIGHTHKPFAWHEHSYDKPHFPKSLEVSEYSMALFKDDRAIINVGSVGQPRDGDPRATYAIYDTDKQVITWYKVPYAVDRTIGLMQRAGFSSNACERLMFGR